MFTFRIVLNGGKMNKIIGGEFAFIYATHPQVLSDDPLLHEMPIHLSHCGSED